MSSVLITGANRGLGLEFARQYAADGWRVFACCRDPGRAEALAALDGEISLHRLDVADFERIEALARELEGEPIDLLLNNAGVYGPGKTVFGGVAYGPWAEVMRVNCFAPLKMAESFVDHVAGSGKKLIVSITSQMGSIADNTTGRFYIYRSSKAALNMVMKSLAIDLGPRGITVTVFHPGWVKTDMGGADALLEPADSVSGMRAVIARHTPAGNGGFYGNDGTEIPW